MEARLARHFAGQYGLITREQALAVGATARIIHNRLATGRWVRVGGGVYRLAGVPVTWHQRALAACLIAGPGAVVSHRSAAVLFTVSGFRPGAIDITVPPGRSGRNAVASVHRAELPRRDCTKIQRVPVTRPHRLLIDLARTVGEAQLREAVDDVLCRRLVTLNHLLEHHLPRRLTDILAAWTPGALPGSPAEMELVRALLAAGLPDPVRQHWIEAASARVDLAYPESRVAIELDSFRWHGGLQAFSHDRSRGNRIVAAGWRLLRATPGDLSTTVSAAAALVLRAAA